jgi:hypothetical protein
LAAAIETLIAWGHPPQAVWSYTFRQMSAYIELGQARRRLEQAQDLSLATLAARGREEDLKKTHGELIRGAHV